MKRFAFVIAILVAALATGVARADCPPLSFSITPFGDDYSVLFDQMVATQSTPAICNDLTVANAVAPVVVGVYSAEYRGGFDDTAAVGRLTVSQDGVVIASSTSLDDPEAPGVGNLFYRHLIGTDSNGDIKSDIELELLQSATSFDTVTLDTVDYSLLATANLSDVQISIDQLSAAHTALVTHLNATADLLTGAGHPLDEHDGVSVFGGVGSFTTGATGLRSLGNGLTVLGGAATFSQSAGGAAATGLLFSGSLRYLSPDQIMVRPYGEIGLITAPAMGLSFTRSYVTSDGTTTVSGSTTGTLLGGFLKGGALVAPDENNEVVLSATLAEDWLTTGAYAETLDGSNLFAATTPAQSSSFDTIKAGVDWTTKVAPKTKLTLSGAIGRTIAETPVSADIAFAGAFSGAPVSETFAEYGVRVGYDIDAAQSVGAFLHGSTGQISGSHVQVGGDYHVNF
jgi:hypothetical protein